MGPDVQVMRQWKPLSARALGVSLADLAREFEVNERTIRDLEQLQQLGFPLAADVGVRGKESWKLGNSYLVPGMTFPYDEALARYLGPAFLSPWLARLSRRRAASVRQDLDDARPGRHRAPRPSRRRVRAQGLRRQQLHRPRRSCRELLRAIAERNKVAFVTYQSTKSTEPAGQVTSLIAVDKPTYVELSHDSWKH